MNINELEVGKKYQSRVSGKVVEVVFKWPREDGAYAVFAIGDDYVEPFRMAYNSVWEEYVEYKAPKPRYAVQFPDGRIYMFTEAMDIDAARKAYDITWGKMDGRLVKVELQVAPV